MKLAQYETKVPVLKRKIMLPTCHIIAYYGGKPPSSCQGSKFMVALVANVTMFSHLLQGCSSGSKHLLLPYIFGIVNLVHAFCVMFVMRSATQPKKTAAALLWHTIYSTYIFIA